MNPALKAMADNEEMSLTFTVSITGTDISGAGTVLVPFNASPSVLTNATENAAARAVSELLANLTKELDK